MRAVEKAVNDFSGSTESMRSRGARHVKRGILKEHYDVVGQAMIKTLETGLGDAMTDELRECWIKVYGMVKDTMISNNYDWWGKTKQTL